MQNAADNAKDVQDMDKNTSAIRPCIANVKEEQQQPSLFDECCIYIPQLVESIAIMFLLSFAATLGFGAGILTLVAMLASTK